MSTVQSMSRRVSGQHTASSSSSPSSQKRMLVTPNGSSCWGHNGVTRGVGTIGLSIGQLSPPHNSVTPNRTHLRREILHHQPSSPSGGGGPFAAAGPLPARRRRRGRRRRRHWWRHRGRAERRRVYSPDGVDWVVKLVIRMLVRRTVGRLHGWMDVHMRGRRAHADPPGAGRPLPLRLPIEPTPCVAWLCFGIIC